MKTPALLLALALSACAAPPRQPAIGEYVLYAGAGAMVADSMPKYQNSRAEFCVLKALAGKTIDTAISETRTASFGKGATILARPKEREVDAASTQATIACETFFAAPVLALLQSAPSVEGVVDFKPKRGRSYVVKGQLSATESAVWIEDAHSGELATSIVRRVAP
jgi:hypothetical protein